MSPLSSFLLGVIIGFIIALIDYSSRGNILGIIVLSILGSILGNMVFSLIKGLGSQNIYWESWMLTSLSALFIVLIPRFFKNYHQVERAKDQ